MSKVLIINGSPNEHGCCGRALQEVINELHQNDIETELMWLGKKPMNDCIACFSCQQTGQCVFKDQVNEAAALMKECDAIIVASPVYYGGPNGRLTSFLDRLIFSTPAKDLEGKFAASVVSCRRSGATAAFQRLNQYFLMSNMTVVASQYWNNVHGSSAEDVEKDEEGLQTMRTLAKNMAFYIKCVKQSGVDMIEHEQQVFTNFISE